MRDDAIGEQLSRIEGSIVEVLRKNGVKGVDGDTAFKAAAEIERRDAEIADRDRKIVSLNYTIGRQIDGINGLRDALTKCDKEILARGAEIDRLKNTPDRVALNRAWFQGYRLAVATIVPVVSNLLATPHDHEDHHHGEEAQGQGHAAPEGAEDADAADGDGRSGDAALE